MGSLGEMLMAVACSLAHSAASENPLAFDADETGFIVGIAGGSIRYELDGSLGKWSDAASGELQSTAFHVGYRFNPWLSVDAFQEMAGRAKSELEFDSASTAARQQRFKSKVSGLSLIGTLFPYRRVRLRGIVSGVWAKQSLDVRDYRVEDTQRLECSKDPAPPYLTTCFEIRPGDLGLISAQKDSQSRLGFGAGIGIEAQWFSHVRATIDLSRRVLGDDYFEGSVRLDSTQTMWTIGLQYGPF